MHCSSLNAGVEAGETASPCEAEGFVPTDEQILEAAMRAKNGQKFARLFVDGDTTGYATRGRAELGLCSMLAYYAGHKPERIDRLFRRSAMMGPTWDEPQGEQTHGAAMIARALDGKTEFHQWESPRPRPADDGEGMVTNGLELDDEKPVPWSMEGILQHLGRLTGDWPRRLGTALFVHDAKHGIGWLNSPADLFGYLHRRVGAVRWYSGKSFVKQPELFAELRRTSTSYVAVENLPHEPAMKGHYYACEPIPPSDGATLRNLIDRFAPETDIDRDLILAMLATPLWGGAPGSRPAFVITSDVGRGVGKSKLAELVGLLYGGVVDFSRGEEAPAIKTRLLSADALPKRVALIDNVKSRRFSWDDLESLITAPAISGHQLYVGDASRPNTITWLVTLNGCALATDMAQRSVIVKLRRPDRSAKWEQDVQRFIIEQQRPILGDLVAFLRSPPGHLDKFSRWATWEAAILSRLPEPSDAQRVILERQAVVDVDQEEAGVVEEYFESQLSRLGYRTASERVFIPSAVAAQWYARATNEKVSVIGAGRILAQLASEGQIRRLSVCASRSIGRGLVWAGDDAALSTTLAVDLPRRLSEERGLRDGKDG